MAKWRTPKQEDLNGKDFIECQVRNRKNSPWRKARLVRILKEESKQLGASSFQYAVVLESAPPNSNMIPSTPRFKYCRIKESVESTTDSTTPKVVEYSPGDIVYITHGEHREKAKVLVCSCESGDYIYRVQSLEDNCRYTMYWYELELCTKATEASIQDNQTYTNEQGGKQSFVSARFDCIPPVVLRLLAQCLGFGARKYGKDNWKNIEQWDHLNHAMNHINEWNRGDRSEPHLVNAIARLTFALWQAVDQKQQPDTYIHPDEVK